MSDPIVVLRNVTKRYGRINAVDDVSFEVGKGETVALLGPSGCGKTTTLRIIAGFVGPEEGEVLIGGRDMRGVRPYERNIGLVFQDYALFPHMSVAQNVAYGLRQRRFERSKVVQRTADMLALVRLADLGERRPGELSGGQQQRVALARALATNPEVVLLDEPLSALDAKLREELRSELKDILRAVGSTTIFVTHDQEEAMSLAERIVVMQAGAVAQEGSPAEIYGAPRTRFVAEFIGRSNWFSGTLCPAISHGLREFKTRQGVALKVADRDDRAAGGWSLCIRPERVFVRKAADTAPPGAAWDNELPGTVTAVTYLGSEVRYAISLASGEVVSAIERNQDQPLHPPGTPCVICFSSRDSMLVADAG